MPGNLLSETEFLELKKSTSELKEAIISVAAMLNKHGKGILYFGIRNDGKALGPEVGEKTIRDISQAVSENIEPRIYPVINEEIISGKKCVKVEFCGCDKPYLAYGRAYMRVADENRQMSARELENMFLKKTENRWEAKTSEESIEDADEETLKEFIEKANKSKRINYKYDNKTGSLKKLGLVREQKLINAGRMLFSNNQPVEVQAAVFAGTSKTTFLDIKQYKGNIFQMLKSSESYIKEHMNWEAKMVERNREEIPEIPLRAITEALVNSFCHRDYQAPESNKIAVYKDRIEIWNPGEFPEGHKPEDFIKSTFPRY